MRRRSLRPVAAATIGALAGLLGVTGCSQGDRSAAPREAAQGQPLAQVKALEDPKAYEGASTAVLKARTITPVARAPKQQLPVTVTSYDRDGEQQIKVTDTSRVVAIDLAGSVSATVWGLGFGPTQVGRDMSTTFPEAAKLTLVTAGGHTVNAEAIIALKPTLVITDGSVGPRDVLEQLRDVGIPVVFVKNTPSFEGAASLATQVAAVYGAPQVGQQLAAQITAQVKATRATIAAMTPSDPKKKLRMVFLYLRGSAGIYYLFGKESGADRIITALGGIDVADELGWDGMKPMTDEAMVKANPDLILVMSGGLKSVGGIDGLIAAKPAIALTAAGQKKRFVDMADGDIVSFGPRSADVLDALARAIYAPATTSPPRAE